MNYYNSPRYTTNRLGADLIFFIRKILKDSAAPTRILKIGDGLHNPSLVKLEPLCSRHRPCFFIFLPQGCNIYYTHLKDLHQQNLVSSIITVFVSILSSILSITIYIDHPYIIYHPHIDREEFKSAIEDSSSFTTALSDEKREEVRRRTHYSPAANRPGWLPPIIWVNYNDLTATSLGMMVNKGSHPQNGLNSG